MSGSAPFVRLAPNVRLVVLPVCGYCKALAPDCECGYPVWKKEGR